MNKVACFKFGGHLLKQLLSPKVAQPRRTTVPALFSIVNFCSGSPSTGEVTLQKDGTINNLDDIINLSKEDQRLGGYRMMRNENILKAMTLFVDRPWWTARLDNGKAVGFILGTHIGDDSRTGSQFVHPNYRGCGIGAKLMNCVFQDLIGDQPDRNLTSYVNQNGKSSCQKIWPSVNVQNDISQIYHGVPKDGYDSEVFKGIEVKFQVLPITKVGLRKIVMFDSFMHGFPRAGFLRAFLNPSVTVAFGAVDQITQDVVGYGCIQESFDPNCLIVAPLYAENDTVALALLHHLLTVREKGQQITFTTSNQNKFIASVAKQLGLKVIDQSENIFLHHPLNVDQKKVYMTSSNNITFI